MCFYAIVNVYLYKIIPEIQVKIKKRKKEFVTEQSCSEYLLNDKYSYKVLKTLSGYFRKFRQKLGLTWVKNRVLGVHLSHGSTLLVG